MKPAAPKPIAWIAMLALLPLVLLAAVALRSLRTDQEALESTAQRELASLSARLAGALETRLGSLVSTPEKTLSADFVTRAVNPNAYTTSWRVDANSEPIDIYFAPEIPAPPPWWLNLTEGQRANYRGAVEFDFESTNAAPIELPPQAREALRFQQQHRWGKGDSAREWEGAGDTSPIVLPSGISVGEIQLWRSLNSGVTESNIPAQMIGFRRYLKSEHPTIWPELRERLLRWNEATKSSKGDVGTLLRFGEFREIEREKLATWRRLRRTPDLQPGAEWLWVGTNLFLAILQPINTEATNSIPGPGSARAVVSFLHEASLTGLILDALQELAPETPSYSHGSVWLADRVWTPTNVHPDWKIAPAAGRWRLFQTKLIGGGELHGMTGYEIADRPLLLAGHRRRAWTLGSLIVGAALISALGFWQMQRALIRQHQLAEQQANFVSSVSHELRAPVASVSLMVERLRNETSIEPGRRTEYLRLIGRECRRLGQLIQNVLATRRLDQSGQPQALEPLDLGQLVKETAAGFAPLATEQGVQVELPPPISAPSATSEGPRFEVLGDCLALQQALTNLLENALKHSPRGGVITVDLRSANSGRRVQVRVTDTGPGVPPEDRERIFERFYRRGSELRRETEGIGLGLALVRHTVESHGGTVRCQTGEQGRGARFILEFPLFPSQSNPT